MESSFMSQNQEFSITDAVDSFNDILYPACQNHFKRLTNRLNLKRNWAVEKWFDLDLKRMRREMLKKSTLLSGFPKKVHCFPDPVIRGFFFKFRKLQSRACKRKYREFKVSLITQILWMKMIQSNWKFLKKLERWNFYKWKMALLQMTKRIVKPLSKSI